MYTLNKCLAESCQNGALTVFDENGTITEKDGYCIDHIPDPQKAQQDVYQYINTHDKIVGLNACGIIFSDIDLTNKRFYGCNFQHCQFSNLHSEGFRSRMSMFDFAVFKDCNWLKSNMQFTSFAGCTFTHTLFTGSDMIHNNFCGIAAYQSSFDDSDLYNSRFVRAKLIDTSFRNCNIKRTIFYDLEQKNVSFKMSNTREAIFSLDETELAGGKNIPESCAL
ncbi:MAG: pentapeptide repeat-containing protein [Treponema sp.]|jgi:uncharacterized protein YjbI with pentapeptide repeats|nr:pentapeptide repeat-containing protein [Treponema sp.]